MKNWCLLVVVFLCFHFTIMVGGAPMLRPPAACLLEECDPDSGPVCGIDATGLSRTFENSCMAMLAFCRSGSYFAEVQSGEC